MLLKIISGRINLLLALILGLTLISTSVSFQASAASFADPAFNRVWNRTDLQVFDGRVSRTYLWGPEPFTAALQEDYMEAPGGKRLVQYFDKSRMEINNPKGDRADPWFVSNGLLVRELITGQIAQGNNLFEQRNPARLQVAGDITPANPAPTYAMFGNLITNGPDNRSADRTGQMLSQGLSAGGAVQTLTTPPENLKLAAYINETGHNIPQVFYDFMLGSGKVYENGYKDGQLRDWVFGMGYPISEAYWIKATVGGVERDVLVQLFERRVLTYTPSNSPEWRIEMANVGQHYYLWRYGRSLLGE
jgi:polysaccharide biosynthesis protein PslG